MRSSLRAPARPLRSPLPLLTAAWIGLAALAGTTTTSTATPDEPPAQGVASEALGPHFRITCHFRDDAAAATALATVEATWSRAVALFGEPPSTRQPLAVHLYRNAADYERVEQSLTGGAFRRNLAFAHHETATAHVALQPDVTDTTLRALGLPGQTRRLLAHEATHLVRYAAMEDYRTHPGWFCDGAALFVADATMRDLGVSPGLAADPITSTWILQARRALEQAGDDLVRRTFADDAADLGMYARYALRGLLFTWLAEGPRREDLRRFLARVRRIDGAGVTAARFDAAVAEHLRPAATGPDAIAPGFRAWLASLEPTWDQVFRALEVRGGEWIQIAFPATNAIAWRTAPAEVPFTLEASVEVLPAATRQMNVLLGRRGDDFVAVTLVAGGGVSLLRYHAAEDRYETLAHAEGGGLEVGTRRRVAVTARRGGVQVALEGVPVLDHRAPGLDLAGVWGLGALAGSAGIWSDVRLR